MIEANSMPNRSILQDKFHGATVDELRRYSRLRRIAAVVDQRVLFAHAGTIELTDESLTLGTWRILDAADLVHVSMEFVPGYNRLTAGGARGGFPSFGFFKGLGAPLLLDLRTGERLVILIGFTWWSGSSKGALWLPALKAFAGQAG